MTEQYNISSGKKRQVAEESKGERLEEKGEKQGCWLKPFSRAVSARTGETLQTFRLKFSKVILNKSDANYK
jgi:hypothetical protein